MNTERGRDQSIEPLLRRSLRAGAGAPASDACLDGETLAAWVDGGLDEHARATAEAHVSGCARCQALVGVMARSAPELAVTAPWWRGSWNVRWLVPLAAGAAAIALWVMVPEPPPLASPGTDRALSTPALADQERSLAPPVAAPAPVAPPPQVAPPLARRADESPAAAPQAATPPAVPPPPAASAPSEAPSIAPFAPVVPQAQPDATLRARKDPPAALEEKVTVVESRDAALDRLEKPRPVLERDRAASNRREQDAAAAAKPTAEQPPAATAGAPVPPPASLAAPKAVGERAAIGALAGRARLCGATWERMPTGVPVELTAGSSPSASVCWVIGRAGTVLLSTDRRTWARLPFPEAADLKTVQAVDARTATVTTIDGRTFRTTDGGKTWNLP